MDEEQEDVQRFSPAASETASQALRSPAEAGMVAVTSPSTLPAWCWSKGAREPRGVVRMLLEHPRSALERAARAEEKLCPSARGQRQRKR